MPVLTVSRDVLFHVVPRIRVVSVEHRRLTLLLMDCTQYRCMDEDPSILHRFKIHVQARDGPVG